MFDSIQDEENINTAVAINWLMSKTSVKVKNIHAFIYFIIFISLVIKTQLFSIPSPSSFV